MNAWKVRLRAALVLLGSAALLPAAGVLRARAETGRAIAGLPPALNAAWQPGALSGPLDGVPIRNFGVVSPGCLYRSAQPGDDADYEWLIRQGVKSIVCLREEHDCGDRARWLAERGVVSLHLPIKNEHAPTDEQAREFLAFVRDPGHWPVLVHCKDGIGRASTMAALARYSIDGWPMSRALDEARKYRPLQFPMFGEQRRWLNHWKARFAAGEYAPNRSPGPEETGGG